MRRDKHYTGMKRMIRLNMILVPLIPLVLILGIGNYYFRASLESHALASTQRIVRDHRTMLEPFLNERIADLKHIADIYSLNELSNPSTVNAVFKRLQSHAPAFSDLGVFNSEGVHLAYSGPAAASRQKPRKKEK
jgi:two-component system, NtrC family, sensor kinase